MKPWFSLFGLGLDVLGVVVLGWGTLSAAAASIRYRGQQPPEMNRRFARLPVWLALMLGSRDPRDAMPSVVEDISAAFWGLLLIFVGFVLQAVSPLLSILGR